MLRIWKTVTLFTVSDVQVVKCSACVVRDWGKETPAHDVLQVLIFFFLYKWKYPTILFVLLIVSDSSEAWISRDIFFLKGPYHEMDFLTNLPN